MIFFAGVLGCIDGTHIPIGKPHSQDCEEYRCRKGFFSINVQAVCNPNLSFSNIVARWKGSTHDSRIWLNSRLCSRFETNEFQGYLLGDNGYGNTNNLLTPILSPRLPSERRYNKAHIKTRNTVERTFGVWKSRFQCLRNTLRFSPRKCWRIIVAAAIVHNFLIERRDLFTGTVIQEDEENMVIPEIGNHRGSDTIRIQIISSAFDP